MRILQPKRHANGQWFCYWGGHNHYYGKGRRPDPALWIADQQAYADWYEHRRRTQPVVGNDPLLIAIAEQFIAAKRTERGWQADGYYRKHLKRMLLLFGDQPASAIRPRHLNALKLDMLDAGFAPKTIDHDLGAFRTMMSWAAGLELIERPVSFAGVKKLPVGPPEDHALSRRAVRELIGSAPERIRPWLAISYLAFLRPSETVRVVAGQGHWARPGIFVLDRGKMDARASLRRHCVFTPLALRWLRLSLPIWSRLDSFSTAARRETGHPPSILRDSAASHFHQHCGASRDETELMLGHYGGRLRVTYYVPAFVRLRWKARRLALGFAPG